MVASKSSFSVKVRKSSDRHLKVNGRDRRIRLPLECANRIFYLMKMLGHRTAGQTVEWLLSQAKLAISGVLSGNAPQPLPAQSATTLVLPKETSTMSSVQSPVKLDPDFLCGVEPEYTPMEMAWILFQSSVANQHV